MSAPFRQRLVSIAAAVRVGALDQADSAHIANAFDAIVLGASADDAFGLRLKPGEHRSAAAIAARDRAIRETVQRWPDVGDLEQGAAIERRTGAISHWPLAPGLRSGRQSVSRRRAAQFPLDDLEIPRLCRQPAPRARNPGRPSAILTATALPYLARYRSNARQQQCP